MKTEGKDSHLLAKDKDLEHTPPSQPSEATSPMNILIWESQLPELRDNKFPFVKPPTLWCFVMETPVN